ncbi:NAD(P)-dependent dehydrogenase, short-chain alcohol dehydrogenase family [Sphingobium sp. AP50]|uniref:SDR family NAD(P)-dependent oxidoreductase n=1 Tax=Sphingobium sp. AP50 TaxID=1884369 RepID=UPI0008D5BBC5|nr:SDR family oxidoreductase [Sphingobium sp. AP50]SEJ82184.1 NAD(P)-dependent dehydrogenase, short-chain alcohol dehydrogenase family [Sphingobium sp. AP50]
MKQLENQTALITGASRGLGRATALRLAKAGAHIIAHYSNSTAGAEAVAEEIRAGGGRVDLVAADLSAPDGAHQVARAIKELGVSKIDILAANAGTSGLSSIEEQTVENFDYQFAVNVRAPFFLVQQLLPFMHTGGRIVLWSSNVVSTAMNGASVYTATKGAIAVLTRNLAKELGPRGIRVNAVAPGAIDTDMAQIVLGNEEGRNMVKSMQALDRIGKPEDIADAVLFLVTDQSRWLDGQSLDLSGGFNL